MLEFSHEANEAYQVIHDSLVELNHLTTTRRSLDNDTGSQVRRHVVAMGNAIDIFVSHCAGEARKKGLFPSIMPSLRVNCDPMKFEEEMPAVKSPAPPQDSRKTSVSRPQLVAQNSGTQQPRKSEEQEEATLPASVLSTGMTMRGTIKGASSNSACVNLPGETAQLSVATSSYVMFDVLMRQIEAKEGIFALAIPSTEEVQAVSLYGGKPRPPSTVRLSLKSGVIGSVIRTGMAVNISPEKPTESNPVALCFPVFPANVRGAPIGAVFAQHKTGNTAFTRDDEELVLNWGKLASQLLHSFKVNLFECYFDPYRVLLKSGPQTRKKRQEDDAVKQLRAALSERGVSDTLLKCSSYSAQLAGMIASHPTKQLVFRCVHHNHFATVRGAHLGGAGVTLQTQNLVDVAEYVTSVEECWRRSTDDLQGMEREQVANMEDFKDRKKKLKGAQKRINQLEDRCDSFKSNYENLKRELSVLCGAPIDVENAAELEEVSALGFVAQRRRSSGIHSSAGGDSGKLPQISGASPRYRM